MEQGLTAEGRRELPVGREMFYVTYGYESHECLNFSNLIALYT